MKRSRLFTATALLTFLSASPVLAQAEPLLGQIMPAGFTFCPYRWADASGQILSIASNTALFSLYGCTYGGDCRVTFGLPNINGRAVMGVGTGPGLPVSELGESLGTATTTLLISEMPAHSHSYNATSDGGTAASPTGTAMATYPVGQVIYSTGSPNVTMAMTAVGVTGGNQPFDQHQPSLALRYCVATSGDFPQRP